MGKVWWKSKTYWFNFLTALVALANELAPVFDTLDGAGYDNQTVATVRAGVAFASIVGNMILRAMTVEPVRL